MLQTHHSLTRPSHLLLLPERSHDVSSNYARSEHPRAGLDRTGSVQHGPQLRSQASDGPVQGHRCIHRKVDFGGSVTILNANERYEDERAIHGHQQQGHLQQPMESANQENGGSQQLRGELQSSVSY